MIVQLSKFLKLYIITIFITNNSWKLCSHFQRVCNTKVTPNNVLPGLMPIKNNGVGDRGLGVGSSETEETEHKSLNIWSEIWGSHFCIFCQFVILKLLQTMFYLD